MPLEPSFSSVYAAGGPRRAGVAPGAARARAADGALRLGPVRIAPWAPLHDLAYVHSLLITGQRLPNDLTATGGRRLPRLPPQRLQGHLDGPGAPRVRLVADARPQRRQLNGRYLLGFNGFFNHLTVEVPGGAPSSSSRSSPPRCRCR